MSFINDRITQVHDYAVTHVIHHGPEGHEWNIPFAHIGIFDYLRYDSIMLFLATFLLIILCAVFYKRQTRVPHGFSNLLEIFVLFIRDKIAIEFLGQKDGRLMTPLFCTFFLFILTLSLLGLCPLFEVATGNINVTGALAIITLFFIIIGGIYKNGFIGFIKTFTPKGVPFLFLIIITPLEIISMVGKTAALMIRLFANMMAGHIVIFSILGLVYILGYIALPVVLIGAGLFMFEVFISLLQAYIFTLLSAIFISQAYHPEH